MDREAIERLLREMADPNRPRDPSIRIVREPTEDDNQFALELIRKYGLERLLKKKDDESAE